MATTYYPYLGSGKIYARTAGASAGLMELGNASKLELSIKEDKQTIRDFSKAGGGIYASVSRIDTATLGMTLHDLNRSNVARALFGSESTVASGSVTDEAVVAYKGALVPLAHPQPSSVVVTNDAASVTYVAGADYEVRSAGIYVLPSGAITDAQVLKVDYAHAAYDQVQAATSSSLVLELHFEGLNEANSGKPVIVDVWRAQLSPTKALSLLGDKFADLQLDAEVLADTSKAGTGVSQYFRVRMA